jgi:hypothetical protein
METVNLVLIILAVFVALFLTFFQYIYKNNEESQLKYWLSFFRFITIFSILILLINPSVKKETLEVVKLNLVVAIDNSASIKYGSQETSINNILNLLKKDSDLNDRFSIDYYSFGSELKIVDSLKFNEPQTNLFLPFNEFSKIYKNEQAPVVIITDGNQTVGKNIEVINYKNPVFPVIVGDTTKIEDIFINQLNVNKYTFKDNQFPVELFVNYEGNKSVAKVLTIQHKGNIVFSKELQFSKQQNAQTVSFFLKADEPNIQFYTATIESLQNEQNTLNNTKNFSIEVIEEQSEILILTSINHPDIGMFKKSIESNKQRKVTIASIENYKRNISDYQLVILYQPNQQFKSVFNEIITNNSNYFVVSGLNTNWDFLNSIQANFNKKSISEIETYQAVLNSNYAGFMTDDIGFSSFPPLEDTFGKATFSVPNQVLLFQKIGAIETENPLLVTFENNTQKAAILFGENSWRWRMSSFQTTKTFEYFDSFIANITQYLVSNFKSKRLNVSVNPLYFSNETIQISANYLDANLNVATNAKLWLTVTNKESNFISKIPFTFVNNRFIVELSNIPENEYTYTVTVENESDNVTGMFKVLPFDVEQQFTQANDEPLKKIASKTGGVIFYNNQGSDLIDLLKSDTRFKSIQKTTIKRTPLIDWKWLLGLLLLSLSVEWFTRKYFGKI